MRKSRLIFFVPLILLAACSSSAPPTRDPAEVSATTTAAAENVQNTLEALTAGETQAAGATETQAASAAATATRAAIISSFVQELAAEGTPEAEDVLPVIEDLYSSGLVPTTEGALHRLEDFSRDFGSRDYFHRYVTGESPFEFVFRSMVTIESTEDNDTTVAGCGLTFRKDDDNTGDYILVDFRGRLRFGVITPDYWSPAGSVQSVLDNTSEPFELMLVMAGREYRVFINGEEALKRQAVRNPGGFWYLIAAGSEPMRCRYEGTWIWEFPEG